MNILLFFISLIIGILALVYPVQIVNMVGHMEIAEEKFGPGGTYTAWRLIGLIMLVASVVILRYG